MKPERQAIVDEAEAMSKRLAAQVASLVGELDRVEGERDSTLDTCGKLASINDTLNAQVRELRSDLEGAVRANDQAAVDLAGAFQERDSLAAMLQRIVSAIGDASAYVRKRAPPTVPPRPVDWRKGPTTAAIREVKP